MKEKQQKDIKRSLRELESTVCDLETIIDNLDRGNSQEYALAQAIFNLTCDIYAHRNKIKKLLDNIK